MHSFQTGQPALGVEKAPFLLEGFQKHADEVVEILVLIF